MPVTLGPDGRVSLNLSEEEKRGLALREQELSDTANRYGFNGVDFYRKLRESDLKKYNVLCNTYELPGGSSPSKLVSKMIRKAAKGIEGNRATFEEETPQSNGIETE